MKASPLVIVDRKIRVGVVGCGRIAENHFKSFEQHSEHLALAAVCDGSKPALERAMQQYTVPGFSDLDSLLASSDADVVVLCTPSGVHAQQTIKAAAAGKHIITEKPMATRWKDGLAMIKACDEANRHLFVVKQNRRNPTLQLLKQAIDKNRFGRIYLVNVNVFWTRPQSYYDQVPWRGTWEYDGGAFMNQASHYVDLLTWLFGPVQSVHAMMGTLARKIETEDTGVLNLSWRSGTLGSMNVTMLTYPQNLEASITVLGEKGSVKIGGLAVNQIETWKFADEQPEDQTIASANEATTAAYGLGHPLYYKHIIEVLRGQENAEVSGREGLKSLELLVAAYLSARQGQVISLPLEY